MDTPNIQLPKELFPLKNKKLVEWLLCIIQTSKKPTLKYVGEAKTHTINPNPRATTCNWEGTHTSELFLEEQRIWTPTFKLHIWEKSPCTTGSFESHQAYVHETHSLYKLKTSWQPPLSTQAWGSSPKSTPVSVKEVDLLILEFWPYKQTSNLTHNWRPTDKTLQRLWRPVVSSSCSPYVPGYLQERSLSTHLAPWLLCLMLRGHIPWGHGRCSWVH